MYAQPACVSRVVTSTRATNDPQANWLRACAIRLAQLRPHHDWQAIQVLAQELWMDVAAFDPEIAAEMEHEAWKFDD